MWGGVVMCVCGRGRGLGGWHTDERRAKALRVVAGEGVKKRGGPGGG